MYERDRRTDTRTPHDDIGRACIASRGKNLLTSQTEGAINKMSLAYDTIWTPLLQESILAMSPKYRAKRNGERTEPCLD